MTGTGVALSMRISQTFPMMQVVRAQDQISTGHTRARIVLKIERQTGSLSAPS